MHSEPSFCDLAWAFPFWPPVFLRLRPAAMRVPSLLCWPGAARTKGPPDPEGAPSIWTKGPVPTGAGAGVPSGPVAAEGGGMGVDRWAGALLRGAGLKSRIHHYHCCPPRSESRGRPVAVFWTPRPAPLGAACLFAFGEGIVLASVRPGLELQELRLSLLPGEPLTEWTCLALP